MGNGRRQNQKVFFFFLGGGGGGVLFFFIQPKSGTVYVQWRTLGAVGALSA